MIAFMGEERVLCGGDNVLVATTEASLSEIKHDGVEGSAEKRGGGGGGEGRGSGREVRRKLYPALEIFLVLSD